MLKRSKKGLIKKLTNKLLLCLLFVSMASLTGCTLQSVDKGSSVATIEYICSPVTDSSSTRVNYAISIQNNSIFNMNAVHYRFDLYKDDVFLETTDYINEDILVKHGDNEVINGYFIAQDMDVDRIEFHNWYSEDLNFWQTYEIWIIVISVLTILGAIGYAIWVFVEDIDLDEIWDDITDFDAWWLIILLPFLAFLIFAGLIPLPNVGWVPLCLLLGSFIAFIIIGLTIHIIHHFVAYISDFSFGSNVSKNEDSKNLTKEELIDYCRENGVKRYSGLNKQEIIDLINQSENEIDEDSNDLPNEQIKNKISTKKKEPVNQNKITFNSIVGLEEAKKAFQEKVILPFKHPEVFEKYHKKSGGGILLYGLPGTGKTMFAEACSNEVDALFIPIKCSDIKSKWYGESEQNIKKIFDQARNASKAIIFFDEFEAIGSKRTDDGNNGNGNLVPEILAEMQGVGNFSNSTVVVIAATNKPWLIDSAFMRPGRFDEKIYIPLLDYEARSKLFNIYLSSLPKEEDLNVNYLAEITEGFNGADIKEVCEKLKMIGITKLLETNEEHKINNEDINSIKSILKSSVSSEDIERLEEFKNN